MTDEERKEYNRRYYQEHKERINAQKRKYALKNEEKLKEYRKKYYRENKEKRREYNRQYYLNNKGKITQHTEEPLNLDCPFGGGNNDQRSIEICFNCPEPDCILPI